VVLTAPFSGQVLAVYYHKGDVASQQQPAVTLADVSELHVTVQVDETEVTEITIGDTATITFSALPDAEVTGKVSAISTMGQTDQGLVKYDVEVVLDETDAQIPLGVTADVSIAVDVQTDVLAVPIDALQSDDQGEFVNVVASDGTVQRVNVESGAIVGDSVAVAGSLQPGDHVQIILPDTEFRFGRGNNN
jgi:RND family efflux transporter MFP subunit